MRMNFVGIIGGCKHYNNGEKSIFCIPGAEPEGFVSGRIIKNMKGKKDA